MSTSVENSTEFDDDAKELLAVINDRLAKHKTDRTDPRITTVSTVKKKRLFFLELTIGLSEEPALPVQNFACLLLNSGKVGIATAADGEFIPMPAADFVTLLKVSGSTSAQTHHLLASTKLLIESY